VLGIELSLDKEANLLGKYKVTVKDSIDFEMFYQVYMELTIDEENDQESNKSEYGI